MGSVESKKMIISLAFSFKIYYIVLFLFSCLSVSFCTKVTPPYSLVPVTETSCADSIAVMVIYVANLGK